MDIIAGAATTGNILQTAGTVSTGEGNSLIMGTNAGTETQNQTGETFNAGAFHMITSRSGNKTGAGTGVVKLNNNGTSTGINNIFNLDGAPLMIGAIISRQLADTRGFNSNGGNRIHSPRMW